MADFDLTQTDQQVQNILNDAQGAMGASAQTTLTTEYVMLKDTSGIYHKILKSSFTEAIRDVLAGLLVNNDKGTTISQIAAIASGDFGSITPANLASVLGVFETLPDDFNSKQTGWRYVNGSTANNPYQSGKNIGILVNRIKAGWDGSQTFYNTAGEIYQRALKAENWQSWSRCDNFGCSTLAELKAALAAV